LLEIERNKKKDDACNVEVFYKKRKGKEQSNRLFFQLESCRSLMILG
jgi:hypothetical protein